MKVLIVLFVLILHQAVPATSRGLQPIEEEVKTPLDWFLNVIMASYVDRSIGGVCFFGPTSTAWWKAESVPNREQVFRLCSGIEPCLRMQTVEETKCELIIVVVKGRVYQQMLQLSRVSHWSSRAIHLFVWQDTMPLENGTQLASSLLSFGIIRVLIIHVNTSSLAIKIRFPMLFERTSIAVDPREALNYLSKYNQLANVHGYPHDTLYYTLIPYLYRYDGVFGGPDYKFLQTVLERQNATHYWFTLRADDARYNTTDLGLVDRKRLEARRATFSLNRLLQTDSSKMEKLYLNTFDGMCLLVPRKRLETFILKLWQPFSQYLWYTVMAIVLVAIIGNVAMPQLFAVNYILTLLFGSKTVDYRLKPYDRVIIFILDVLLFLLKEAYTAKIITYMIHTRYETQLDTLAQLAHSGSPLLLTPGDYARLNESLRTLEGLRVIVRDDFSSINTDWRDYFLPEFAHAIPCSYGRALVRSHDMHESGAPKFYLLNEKILIQPEAYTFPRNSPFIERFRFYVECLTESGIFGSWLNDDYYTQDRTPTLDEVLKFENLASLFYVLLVGFAGSMIVFGVELVVMLVHERIKRKRVEEMRRRWRKPGNKKKVKKVSDNNSFKC